MVKKNVLVIVADEWRADSIGYTGNKAVVTPNLDKLAQDGVAFLNAFCQLPVCVPSRCSFMTGWYPHTHGYRTMHYLMPEYEPNMLKTFKNNDYFVYWGGRNDFLRLDSDINKYCNIRHDSYTKMFHIMQKNKKKKHVNKMQIADFSFVEGVKENINTPDIPEIEAANKFIESYNDQKPFLMYLALMLPHPPYEVEQKWYDMIDPKKIEESIKLNDQQSSKKPIIEHTIAKNQGSDKWDKQKYLEMKRIYYAMGTKLDYYVGILIDSLKTKGIYDDTTIVFLSDHGDYTGDFGIAEKNQNTFEDVLTNVPFIIKPAKGQSAYVPRTTDALVELIDMQATLMDMNGIQEDHTQFGKSLAPVLNGDNKFRTYVFSEGGRLRNEPQASEGGSNHTKASAYWARMNAQAQIPEHTKAVMIRSNDYKYIYRLYENDEFYNLKKDPSEKENVISDIKYLPIIHKMRSELLTHMVSTSDVVPFKEDPRFK